MTITVKKNLVSEAKYGLKCPNAMNAEYITIHNTANDASAANEISYMIGNTNSTSYHFAVDDKQVIQGLPTNRNGWHSGDGTYGTETGNLLLLKSVIASPVVRNIGRQKSWQLNLWRSYLKNEAGALIVSASIKTGTESIARTVFCQRADGTRLRLPLKLN